MELMKLHEKLPVLLARARLNQKRFAVALGIDPSRVTEWKNEAGHPALDVAIRAAELLGTTVEYLFTEKEEEPTPPAEDERLILRTVSALGLDADEAIRRLHRPSAAPGAPPKYKPGDKLTPVVGGPRKPDGRRTG